MQIPCTVKINIVTYPGIVGLITLNQNQLAHHFTEFSIRINENNLAGQTSLIRLRQFQQKHRRIWRTPYNILSKLQYQHNLNAYTLCQMHTFDVNIELNSEFDGWNIHDGMTAITNILIDKVGDMKEGLNLLRSFWHSTLPIYCVEQCTSSGDNPEILPWILVKQYSNAASLRGRTPKWYNWISNKANLHEIPYGFPTINSLERP